jgi:hypothetical protein
VGRKVLCSPPVMEGILSTGEAQKQGWGAKGLVLGAPG